MGEAKDIGPQESIPTHSFDSFKIVESFPQQKGAEKEVHKITDGTHVLAAKIFRDTRDNGDLINKEREAKEEYEAYLRFRNSALRPYIPEPHFLLTDKANHVIGLAVEWRNGPEIASAEKKLTYQEWKGLETAALKLENEGPIPVLDMLDEQNIHRDPNLGIWLAECKINKNIDAKQNYVKKLQPELELLQAA
jgi:hypothetical protein